MNQKSRQKATSSVEKDFYKLWSNSNFGIDCRNNIDNWNNIGNFIHKKIYDNF